MEPSDRTNDERIDDLEARLAQQDQSILQLSDELYRQQKQIAKLEMEARHLAERLQTTDAPGTAGSPTDEIPPHY